MRIGEVSKKSGIPASTLRYYERIALIAAPRRHNGQRSYDESIFEQLDIIKLAQSNGFSLGEIRMLLNSNDAFSLAWRRVAHQKLLEIKQTIARLETICDALQMSLTCECNSVESCNLIP